jgi:hyperosmotically inducible periplasmic protein
MNREHELVRHVVVAALIGVVLAISSCDKHISSGETVGQKVDKTIDKTDTAADQASNKMGEAAKSAEQTVKDAADTARQKAGQLAASLDDAAITAAIKADQLKAPRLSALKIDVDTIKGEITLKGEVDSEAARERAGRVALGVTGVVKVNNSISIKG